MATEQYSGKVALRLFLLIVGVLFIWNSIPSHRWTKNVANGGNRVNNIETGPWTTCSCVDNKFNDCIEDYTNLEYEVFSVSNGGGDKRKDGKDLRKKDKPYMWMFHNVEGKNTNVFTAYTNNATSSIKLDDDECNQYNATGAIALISYIFAFLAVLLMVRNISSNKIPVLDGAVFGCILMSGCWGLIATCMFGDLYGHAQYPFGYHFGLFTFAWICFIVVGFTGCSDMRKGANASEGTSAARSAILVCALTAFAFSMGTNWYVVDQIKVYAPLQGNNWTIKTGNFFIENPWNLQRALESNGLESDVLFRSLEQTFNIDLCSLANSRKKDGNNKKDKKGECFQDPEIGAVNGFKEIGLWSTCYCKNTLTTECTLFGSHEIMFSGQTDDCDNFNVARACILIAGILSLFALVLSSSLIGGLRRPAAHITSNTLCYLAGFVGFIASILYGAVLYDVDYLGRDYAIFMAGWILVFISGVLGNAVTAYYNEVAEAGKVQPMVPV